MDISNWLKEWAVPLSAGATFLLAIAAFCAILQNYRIQKKNIDRQSKTKAIDAVQNWIEGMLALKADYEQSAGDSIDGREVDRSLGIAQRIAQTRALLLSRKEWITLKARLIDTEFPAEQRSLSKEKSIMLEDKLIDAELPIPQSLNNIIGRLSFILEQELGTYTVLGKTYSKESLLQEVQNKCNDALKVLNNIRAKEKL